MFGVRLGKVFTNLRFKKESSFLDLTPDESVEVVKYKVTSIFKQYNPTAFEKLKVATDEGKISAKEFLERKNTSLGFAKDMIDDMRYYSTVGNLQISKFRTLYTWLTSQKQGDTNWYGAGKLLILVEGFNIEVTVNNSVVTQIKVPSVDELDMKHIFILQKIIELLELKTIDRISTYSDTYTITRIRGVLAKVKEEDTSTRCIDIVSDGVYLKDKLISRTQVPFKLKIKSISQLFRLAAFDYRINELQMANSFLFTEEVKLDKHTRNMLKIDKLRDFDVAEFTNTEIYKEIVYPMASRKLNFFAALSRTKGFSPLTVKLVEQWEGLMVDPELIPNKVIADIAALLSRKNIENNLEQVVADLNIELRSNSPDWGGFFTKWSIAGNTMTQLVIYDSAIYYECLKNPEAYLSCSSEGLAELDNYWSIMLSDLVDSKIALYTNAAEMGFLYKTDFDMATLQTLVYISTFSQCTTVDNSLATIILSKLIRVAFENKLLTKAELFRRKTRHLSKLPLDKSENAAYFLIKALSINKSKKWVVDHNELLEDEKKARSLESNETSICNSWTKLPRAQECIQFVKQLRDGEFTLHPRDTDEPLKSLNSCNFDFSTKPLVFKEWSKSDMFQLDMLLQETPNNQMLAIEEFADDDGLPKPVLASNKVIRKKNKTIWECSYKQIHGHVSVADLTVSYGSGVFCLDNIPLDLKNYSKNTIIVPANNAAYIFLILNPPQELTRSIPLPTVDLISTVKRDPDYYYHIGSIYYQGDNKIKIITDEDEQKRQTEIERLRKSLEKVEVKDCKFGKIKTIRRYLTDYESAKKELSEAKGDSHIVKKVEVRKLRNNLNSWVAYACTGLDELDCKELVELKDEFKTFDELINTCLKATNINMDCQSILKLYKEKSYPAYIVIMHNVTREDEKRSLRELVVEASNKTAELPSAEEMTKLIKKSSAKKHITSYNPINDDALLTEMRQLFGDHCDFICNRGIKLRLSSITRVLGYLEAMQNMAETENGTNNEKAFLWFIRELAVNHTVTNDKDDHEKLIYDLLAALDLKYRTRYESRKQDNPVKFDLIEPEEEQLIPVADDSDTD